MARGVRTSADRGSPARRRAVCAVPAAVRALRGVAHAHGLRLVPHDAFELGRRRSLQHRARLGLGGRAAVRVSAAGVPQRPAREQDRSSACRHDGRAGSGAVSADSVGGRVLPGTGTVDDVPQRLPRQRVHADEQRTGTHREPRPPVPRSGVPAAVRGGRRATRPADPRSEPPHAPHGGTRAGRRRPPLWGLRGGGRPAEARTRLHLRRGLVVGTRLHDPADVRGVPGGPCSVVGVHRSFDPSARRPAPQPPGA